MYVAHQKDCQQCPVKTECLSGTEAAIRGAQHVSWAERVFASQDQLGWARSRLRVLWKVGLRKLHDGAGTQSEESCAWAW